MTDIVSHLFTKMLRGMGGVANDTIKESILRQQGDFIQWLEKSISETSVGNTAEYVEDLIGANRWYEGSRPDIDSLTGFVEELAENNIQRNTAAFSNQVAGSAQNGTLDTYYRSEGQAVPYENPDRI